LAPVSPKERPCTDDGGTGEPSRAGDARSSPSHVDSGIGAAEQFAGVRVRRLSTPSASFTSLLSSTRRLRSALVVPGHQSRVIAGVSASLMTSQLVMAATAIMSARWLGPSGKGLVAAATTWGQLLGWLAGLGVGMAIQVRVAEQPEEARAAATSTALGNGLLYSAVGGAAVGLLAFLPLTRSLAHLGPESTVVVGLAVLSLPMSVLTTTLGYLLLALGRNRHYSMSLLAGPLTTLALVLAAQVAGALTPVVLVLCYLAGNVVALLISARQLPWRSMRTDGGVLRQDIRFGVKLWLPSVMGLANLRLDVLVMTVFFAAEDIGQYSAANNVMLPVSSIPLVIALVTTSKTARLRTQSGQGSATAAIWRSSRQAFVLSLAVSLLLAVTAPFVVPWLLGDAYRPSIPLIWILSAGNVARAVMGVVVAGANGMRRPRAGYVSEGIGLAVTLVLLALLLPRWGIVGAAVTSTASYCVAAVASLWWLLLAPRSSRTPAAAERGNDAGPVGRT